MPEQRNEEWVAAATPEQIAAARVAGELAVLLGAEVNGLGNTAEMVRG